jgi:hypothetical protein
MPLSRKKLFTSSPVYRLQASRDFSFPFQRLKKHSLEKHHSFLEGCEDGRVTVCVRAVRFHWRWLINCDVSKEWITCRVPSVGTLSCARPVNSQDMVWLYVEPLSPVAVLCMCREEEFGRNLFALKKNEDGTLRKSLPEANRQTPYNRISL